MKGSYTLEDLKVVLKRRLPVFGECMLEVKEDEDGKEIRVIDKDVYNIYVDASGNEIEMEEDIDMSTVPLVIYTDKDNVINFIEHKYIAFTKANKDIVLFVVNLIGKVVEF